MYRFTVFVALGLLLAQTGCVSRGPKGTVKGPTGTMTVSAPEEVVTITQGKEGEVPLVIERNDFDGPVRVSFKLPEGLSMADEKDAEVPAGEKNHIFKLLATPDAKLHEKVRVPVTATYKDLKEVVEFQLTVEESLENRKSRKVAAETAFQDRLGKVTTELDKALKDTTTLPAEAQGRLLKEIGEAKEDLGRAQKKLEELKGTTPNDWERLGQDLTNITRALETKAASITTSVADQAKTKKDE